MSRRLAVLCLVAALACFLGGCWSRREISELAIILAAGVDYTADGKVQLTLQIARPGSFAGAPTGEGGGAKEGSTVWVASAAGKTIFEAQRNLAAQVSRHLYWG
ncbi:MAG: Ger(x)C family spore germination protein, partial [Peptococcaceae bacterium]|nr:Ger(x)C family spore germination protein [Peptococcaceae bacterium]